MRFETQPFADWVEEYIADSKELVQVRAARPAYFWDVVETFAKGMGEEQGGKAKPKSWVKGYSTEHYHRWYLDGHWVALHLALLGHKVAKIRQPHLLVVSV